MWRNIGIGFLLIMLTINSYGQSGNVHLRVDTADNAPISLRKDPVKALSINVGLNMAMRGFNRFILDDEFAKINLSSMGKNLRTLPVWDTNSFSTNLIAHPYHGSMYFNSARTNGYGFYGSIPFTFGGSLMWEYLMETKPPSMNDLVATTVGGTALGEITFRFSDMILDNRTYGVERFARELAAGIFTPTQLVNRVITGEAWRVRSEKGNVIETLPFVLSVGSGGKMIKEDNRPGYSTGVGVEANVQYGNVFEESIRKPYDWFWINGHFNIHEGNVYLTQINGIGAIVNKNLYERSGLKIMGGFFQHFDYYNYKMETKSGEIITPYYISEAAAAGLGLLINRKKENVNLRTRAFINGIGLGASISDYFEIDDRDYNMGSGMSLKLYTDLIIRNKFSISLLSENYFIYTWKGVDEKLSLKDLTVPERDFLNVQGDRSTAKLRIFGVEFRYRINNLLYVKLNNRFFTRDTSYKFFPRVFYRSQENFLSVGVTV